MPYRYVSQREDDDSSSSSSEQEKDKKKKPANKKAKPVLDSYTRDVDEPRLTVPKFALDKRKEDAQDKKKAEVRLKEYDEERERELDAAKEIKQRNERVFEPDVALGYESPPLSPMSQWEQAEAAVEAEADDLFVFDEKTGKTRLAREPVLKLRRDYSMIPIDGTIVVAGIRRSGKTFGVRDILYELRHSLAGGLVFSATKHNGYAAVDFAPADTGAVSGASTCPTSTFTRSSTATSFSAFSIGAKTRSSR